MSRAPGAPCDVEVFSDFLGRVQQDLIRQQLAADVVSTSSGSGCSATAPRVLELTVESDSASTALFMGSCMSRGDVSIAARLKSLGDGGSQILSEFGQIVGYRLTQLSLRGLCAAELLGLQASRFAHGTTSEQDDDEENSRRNLGFASTVSLRRCFSVAIPLPLGGLEDLSAGQLMHILQGWTQSAVQCLADGAVQAASSAKAAALMAGSLPFLQALVTAGSKANLIGAVGGLPLTLKVGSLAPLGFLALEKSLTTHVGLFSLTSAVMFIASIRGLNKHTTAQQGNLLGILATALGILSVMASPAFNGAHLPFFVAFALAGAVGYGVAQQVSMEDMPQLVAGFHSFVGLAAVFTGFASFFGPADFATLRALETVLGAAIGSLTFTGSVVAAGKLQGIIPGAPIILPNRWLLNAAGAATSLFLTTAFCTPSVYGSSLGTLCLLGNTAIWGALGANMVLPVGGADMPVIVSLLNAFSGLATSAAGFMLSNNLLTITGALVASSGTLLSDIMCRGINRSMVNVLMGGFGTEGGIPSGMAAAGGTVKELSAAGLVDMLVCAKRVVIVPGYGLAVARCQQRLADVVAVLRKHGVTVHFAIHPVAGRLPGHMDVLLAEANVPYDIVHTMEEINPDMANYDVAIVVGANDTVNPATQRDPSSPIFGMPAVEVWKAKTCVVMKRSMGTGYSGVDNPLFFEQNVWMLFGDAKQSIERISVLVDERKDRIQGGGGLSSDSRSSRTRQEPEVDEVFPPACKVLGVIRERRPGERRVSIAPTVVPRLRRMGFSILMEAGAGTAAGFDDADYVRRGGAGGVQVAESAVEVLKQADVILKVNEPLLDEVQMLSNSQCMVGFWNMYGCPELLEALKQSSAAFVNLALIPRVSRAQSLDALTSMANVAGYRAVLDAFNRFPRFSRSSVTACGVVPPARVFIIGTGVAGLSAIATAHSLGAKVFANDVRADVAREQVESMGAEFIPVDAVGISGEGVGGYATDVGEAFKQAQLATYARVLPDMDIVVTTAMIPNRDAPKLITDEMLRSMKRGAVIVDLAAATGGNCVATKADQVVETADGITVIGETNYPSSMPVQASEMLGNNFVALLEMMGGAVEFGGDHWDDPVIRAATVMLGGQLKWPPPPMPQPAPPAPAAAPAPAPVLSEVPDEVRSLLEWLQEHREQVASGLGAAVVLGLGFGATIPEEELTHVGYFVLSCLIGHFTVAGVTPALHTPLIAVTNAISGIIVVGGMLQLSGPLLSAKVGCALAAVFLSSVNIVGGFAVTQRMLEMFREDKAQRAVR